MKKILTLLLFLTAMVGAVSAQRATSGTIRVAFTDPTGQWAQSHFYIYVYDTSTNKNDTWPGVDVTENTQTINGRKYYYRDFPIATYGTAFKVIAVNDDGNGNSISQSENLTWCYDRTAITGDTYYSLKDEWESDKRKAELVPMHYVADYDNTGKVILAEQSGNDYSVTFNTNDFPNFVIANSYAFKDDGTLDFSGYPANIYRPDYQNTLAFANVTHNVSDTQRKEFYRWQGAGYFDASNIPGVDIDMTFNITDWNATSYSISPSFTRTLPAAAEGYATFSSAYNVAIPAGLTAQYATGVSGTAISWANYSGGIAAEQGALLHGTAGQQYTFTPATSVTNPGTNLLKPVGSKIQVAQTVNLNSDSYTNFILTKKTTYDPNDDALGFYKVNASGSWCAAGTAYLQVLTSQLPAQGANVFFSLFGEEVTGINAVNMTNDNQAVYDLQGRRVANPTRGLYIVNGKKVVLK